MVKSLFSMSTSLKQLFVCALFTTIGFFAIAQKSSPTPCYRLKTSLNAYSFKNPYNAGTIDIAGMIDYCVELGVDGLDITGYYFPSYPAVPTDEEIFRIKKKAFLAGVAISGTGVRNDFTHSDPKKRVESVQLVKNWIEVAAKLGAPVLRVFAGKQDNPAYSRVEVQTWLVEAIQECVAYGEQYGVVIGLQNHNDFIRTEEDVKSIFDAVNSDWLGLIMDTGGYRKKDPYREIENTIHLAVNWQIKEKIFEYGLEKDTDFDKLLGIIKKGCYQGYIPIETLGPGDAKQKIKALHLAVVETIDNNEK